jgi:prepilin-type N-terminal cleavage/methylation domain-containing protein
MLLKLNKKLFRNQKGFSLIELMVAVAILVMAIFGIFHAFSSGFMGMTDARERTIATNLAQKVMEDIKSKNAISESGYDSETISGKTFDIVASYPEDDPNDVTVTVSWLDRNGNTKSVELNTIFYDLQAPLVEAEIGTIDLESDPDSESITCCDTLTIIATVKDSEGNLVEGGVGVDFSVIEGTGELSASTVPTTDGEAEVELTLNDQNSVTVTASSGETTEDITIDCMPPDLIVEADPNSLAICEESIITATLTGLNEEPIVGKIISFYSDGYGETLSSQTADTDNSGQGAITLSYTGNTQITTSVTAEYCGIQDSRSITFLVPDIDILATPTSLAACQTSEIIATLTDADGPVVGKTVEFSTNFGELSSSTSVTNDSGEATVTLTSDTPEETATVEVTYCGITGTSDAINFNPPDIGLAANPDNISAGGSSVITATISDTAGNLVAEGTEIDFEVTDGSGTLSSDSALTNNDGEAQVTVEHSDEEDLTSIKVQATYCNVNSETDAISITTEPTTYSLSLSSEYDEITSGDPCTITATLLDNNSEPVEGMVIAFNTDIGSLNSTSSTTNSDGEASVELTFEEEDEGETATVTGTYDTVSDSKAILCLGDSPITPGNIRLYKKGAWYNRVQIDIEVYGSLINVQDMKTSWVTDGGESLIKISIKEESESSFTTIYNNNNGVPSGTIIDVDDYTLNIGYYTIEFEWNHPHNNIQGKTIQVIFNPEEEEIILEFIAEE